MKRMILVLAVLALVVPAIATVEIQLIPTLTGFDVAYDASTESGLVRAFALTVEIDGGATIDSVTPAKVGESTEAVPGYGIFPGSITIVGDEVTDDGTPVASSLPATSVILEMGSLYVGEPNAPDTAGILCSVVVTGSGTVTVAEEALRGGVVMENPSAAPDVDVTASITAPGAPDTSCQDHNVTKLRGGTDNLVDAGDVTSLINYIRDNRYAPTVWIVVGGDERFNYDGEANIGAGDVTALINYIRDNRYAPTVWIVVCP